MSDAELPSPTTSEGLATASQAIPQFDAYPLPPGNGMAGIRDTTLQSGKQAETVLTLLKDTTYQKLDTQDTSSVKTFKEAVKEDPAVLNRYLLAVNRDIRMSIADGDWQTYFKDKGVTSENITRSDQNKYAKLQEIHNAPFNQPDANGKTTLEQAREDLIKSSDGKITPDQLKDFEANRLAEAKQAQTVLAAQKVEGKPATGHVDGQLPAVAMHGNGHHNGQGHRDGTGGEMQPMGQWRGPGSDRAEELNYQENQRLQGQGKPRSLLGGASAEQGAGQSQPDWHQSIAAWEQQNLGRVNNERNDQLRYQEDVQAIRARNSGYQTEVQSPGYGVPGAPSYGYPGVAPGAYYGGGYGAGGIGLGLGVNIGFGGIGFGFGPHRPYYAPYNPGYYGGINAGYYNGANNIGYYNGANNAAYYNGANNAGYYNGANNAAYYGGATNASYYGNTGYTGYYPTYPVMPTVAFGFGGWRHGRVGGFVVL